MTTCNRLLRLLRLLRVRARIERTRRCFGHISSATSPGATQAADLAEGLPEAVHPKGGVSQGPFQEGFRKGEWRARCQTMQLYLAATASCYIW